MHRHVVDVGAERFVDGRVVRGRFKGQTEVLLLVHDVMLGTSNGTGVLNAPNRLGHADPGQNTAPSSASIYMRDNQGQMRPHSRVWRKALPVATACGSAP